MFDVEKELQKAVRYFWTTRSKQRTRQGGASVRKDAGDRAAVTGGKHADGFIQLIARIVRESGLPDAAIRSSEKAGRTLPGYFRPTKECDVLVIWKNSLVATVEVKSQVGSFGNNFNNRVEEAVGSAADFWKAYEYGRFQPSGRPWLGYLFMLEEHPTSVTPKRATQLEPFAVDGEFQERSYVGRYELVCQRRLRERLYDAACFFTSNGVDGARGKFSEPNPELGIRPFAISLSARARAFAEMGRIPARSGRRSHTARHQPRRPEWEFWTSTSPLLHRFIRGRHAAAGPSPVSAWVRVPIPPHAPLPAPRAPRA